MQADPINCDIFLKTLQNLIIFPTFKFAFYTFLLRTKHIWYQMSQKKFLHLKCYIFKIAWYLGKIVKGIYYTIPRLYLSIWFNSVSACIHFLYVIIFLKNRTPEMFRKALKTEFNNMVRSAAQKSMGILLFNWSPIVRSLRSRKRHKENHIRLFGW